MPDRYVTQHQARPPRQPDPRPFRPMRPGGFSTLDLPFWAIALGGSTWVVDNIRSTGAEIAIMSGLAVIGGITVSMIRLHIHRRRSKPMISSADMPFN